LNFSKPALLDQEFADLPWHLPDVTRKQKLHLSSPGKLTHNKQQQLQEEALLEYQADSSDEISFTYAFSTKTVQ